MEILVHFIHDSPTFDCSFGSQLPLILHTIDVIPGANCEIIHQKKNMKLVNNYERVSVGRIVFVTSLDNYPQELLPILFAYCQTFVDHERIFRTLLV